MPRLDARPLGLWLLLAFTTGLLGAGCGSDPVSNDPPVTAPGIPHGGGSKWDWGYWPPVFKTAADSTSYQEAVARVTSLRIGIALLLDGVGEAIDLFEEVDPVDQGDGSWLWTATSGEGTLTLRGERNDTGADWEVRWTDPTANPPVTDLLWFEGHTENTGLSGNWNLHDDALEGNPAIARVDYSVEENLLDRTVSLTDIHELNAGDILAYTRDGADHSIVYTDADAAPEDADPWFITWNAETGGSLRVPGFNGGEEACWGPDRQDIACPESAAPR